MKYVLILALLCAGCSQRCADHKLYTRAGLSDAWYEESGITCYTTKDLEKMP